MDLLLASTSTYRRSLMDRLGIPYRSRSPGVDEDPFHRQFPDPNDLTKRLAVAKATNLLPEESAATIIGSDQVVALNGQIFHKPGSPEWAVEQLEQLSGQKHQIVTALAVWHAGKTWTHVDVAEMSMRPLSREEIERYVAADLPIDCGGSYKIEQRGIALFDSIVAADHSAITGLPLMALVSILRAIGYPIP